MAKKPTNLADFSDSVVFRVAQLFVKGVKAPEIANMVNSEFDSGPRLTRERVYPLLDQALNRRFIRLMPPVEEELARRVADRFGCDASSITVVNTPSEKFGHQVAEIAAEQTFRLIEELGNHGATEVGLGLGPGRATLDFARRLSLLLDTSVEQFKLKLFAICAGCPALAPEFASTSFFNLFPRGAVSHRVGLFAESIVPCEHLDDIKTRPGVIEAFQHRDEIDIVVTSMGDMDDDHDLFRMFLEKSNVDVAQLRKDGWIGSVQYRPYTKKGPVTESNEHYRAVTLFELDDFTKMAKTKRKHVVLIARQCGDCARTRAAVLRPLLEVPELRVWSELVVDAKTAKELLAGGPI